MAIQPKSVSQAAAVAAQRLKSETITGVKDHQGLFLVISQGQSPPRLLVSRVYTGSNYQHIP